MWGVMLHQILLISLWLAISWGQWLLSHVAIFSIYVKIKDSKKPKHQFLQG